MHTKKCGASGAHTIYIPFVAVLTPFSLPHPTGAKMPISGAGGADLRGNKILS